MPEQLARRRVLNTNISQWSVCCDCMAEFVVGTPASQGGIEYRVVQNQLSVLLARRIALLVLMRAPRLLECSKMSLQIVGVRLAPVEISGAKNIRDGSWHRVDVACLLRVRGKRPRVRHAAPPGSMRFGPVAGWAFSVGAQCLVASGLGCAQPGRLALLDLVVGLGGAAYRGAQARGVCGPGGCSASDRSRDLAAPHMPRAPHGSHGGSVCLGPRASPPCVLLVMRLLVEPTSGVTPFLRD